jgi:hypothetical protein
MIRPPLPQGLGRGFSERKILVGIGCCKSTTSVEDHGQTDQISPTHIREFLPRRPKKELFVRGCLMLQSVRKEKDSNGFVILSYPYYV